MSETPKLFTRKPKKAQRKPFQGNVATGFSPPPPAPPTPPTPTPAAPVKESFARRYKFLWPLLLTVNLTVGGIIGAFAFHVAYIFMRTKKKDTSGERETAIPVAATNSVPTAAPVAESSASSAVSSQVSAIARQTAVSPVTTTLQSTTVIVPEEQQRELFKWILDEKRRIQPKDTEEKKRIDADKAVLKQFIRASAVPSI